MYTWKEGTEIAIWGTGRCARQFYLNNRNIFNVKLFIDNYKAIDELDGIKVEFPVSLSCKNVKIVIAIENYLDVCEQCYQMGKVFLEDFITYDFIENTDINIIKLCQILKGENIQNVFESLIQGKEYALLIGNCQIPNIKKILLSSRDFQENYILVDIPLIHMIKKDEISILEKNIFIFKQCSLIITQPIKDNNSFCSIYATHYIKKIICPNTRLFIIPVLYFDLYFPQTIHQKNRNKLLEEKDILSFPYGDCFMDELSLKYTPEEITQILGDENFFSRRFLEKFMQDRIDTLHEHEKFCDINISDFILENFKKEQLFYSKNHPTAKVFIEFGKRILNKFGYDNSAVESVKLEELDEWQETIYPSVADKYQLLFKKVLYRDPIADNEMDFSQYIKLYISSLC